MLVGGAQIFLPGIASSHLENALAKHQIELSAMFLSGVEAALERISALHFLST